MCHVWALSIWGMLQTSFLWPTSRIWNSNTVYHLCHIGSGPKNSKGRSAVRSTSEFFRSLVQFKPRALHRHVAVFYDWQRSVALMTIIWSVVHIWKTFSIYTNPDFNFSITQILEKLLYFLCYYWIPQTLQKPEYKPTSIFLSLHALLLPYIRILWWYTILLWLHHLYYHSHCFSEPWKLPRRYSCIFVGNECKS